MIAHPRVAQRAPEAGGTHARTRRPRIEALAGSGIGVVLLVTVWAVAAAGQPELLLPSPAETLAALRDLATDAAFAAELATTLGRAVTGVVAAFVIGALWGTLNGVSRRALAVSQPALASLMALPPVVLVVVSLTWFGPGAATTRLVIVLVAIPLVVVAVQEAVANVDADLLEMGAAFGLSFRNTLRHVVAPAIASPVLAATLVALGQALRVAVMAELLSAADGVGAQIARSRANLETADVFAWALVLVTIVLLVELAILRPVNQRLLRWRTPPQPDQGVPMDTNSPLPYSTTIGSDLDLAKMPGHWLLARMGKRVLRPGGRKLTSFLLDQLAADSSDVVEFAPGVGATTELIVARNPASYTGIERNEAAAAQVAALLDRASYRCAVGSAQHTGLDESSADVVLGEALLTMQTDENKRQIVGEAFRILRPGGRYGVHELSLRPDALDPETRQRVCSDLSGVIRVGARPLTVSDWRGLVERAGFVIQQEATVAMNLLKPRRPIDDEGLGRALRIALNVVRTPAARKRVRSMRAMFRRHRDHLGAVALVATKPKAEKS